MGIKQDLLNIGMIKYSDFCRLLSITCVCFVIQASVIRFMLFNEIIPYIESPYFFKFNNSSIFTKDINNEFNKAFFNISMKNIKDFNERKKIE